MFSLIVAVLFALEMAYFATQNAGTVALRFVNYEFGGIPMYVVVIGSLLLGMIFSWLITSMNSASHFMKLRSKDNLIQKDRKTIDDLNRKIKELELENSRLKNNDRVEDRNVERVRDEDIHHKPSIMQRLFPSSTRTYSKQV